ncbi:aconitate hydratase [Myxococcota bacterium]|nr:aconitate hydratase [Myxococcota bacterium]MBU1413577.1 aconitate hydratase [Myxococcota bacterium]MBU1510601.1 aconitate hydratase [Myxococcota bacterium]
MSSNIVEKILKAHLREGDYVVGQEIGIRIDQTLTQDATGTMAYLQFEAMGLPAIKTDLSVSYVDHNTVQVGFENADDHKYLQSIASRYGLVFSRPGNGICHQVHLERFGKPGTTLLGSDSHTPTGGGVGQIAIGAGGLDVAVAMGGGNFYLATPKVYLAKLTGALKPWVTAKDVILHMLSILSTKGNVGVVLEYGGPGVATLSVPQRATITNMGAEMGVTTSVFPSDEITRQFLKAQKREQDWSLLVADEGAAYDRIIEVDLGEIEPLAACPHSPGNVKPISELAGMKVDQVAIGSCTNSSLKDLRTTAAILKGRKVHPDVSLGIAPGSRQVLQMLSDEGGLSDLLASGARLLENACGFCIGNHFSPKSAGISLRTSNRNFEARSGTADAQIYLVSPEVAAIAALTGEFTDPRAAGIPFPAVSEPAEFTIDDSMFIFPNEAGRSTSIFRGPNIGDPPANTAMADALTGEVTIKVGDKITTDHIMPAGARLKYRSNVPKYAQFVFENVDGSFSKRCLENKAKAVANFIFAGESYGQGSSREHAAMCPMYLGVKAVVAKSFERIHAANLVNFGILPLLFADAGDYDRIPQGAAVVSPNIRKAIEDGEPVILEVDGVGLIKCDYKLSGRQREILLAGGLLNFTTK